MKERYKVLGPLGEGGLGRVQLAQDLREGRKVALKSVAMPLDSAQSERLKQEALLLAALSHPNLVKVFDYDAAGGFYVMEYVAGETLDAAARNLEPGKVIDVFVQFCRGLLYLHAREILHGDLKPSNALLTPEGALKILDFGLLGAGTAAYRAPETFWGTGDAQSDLFSLGVLFYEILAGRLPYKEPLTRLPKSRPPPLGRLRKDLPAFFCELIDRLIDPEPTGRPPSALSLIRLINLHTEKPFRIEPEEIAEAVLLKPAWVKRKEEKSFLKAPPGLLFVKGPTGVGRTRFLEEMTWRWRREGFSFLSLHPGDSVPEDEISSALVIHDLQDWKEADRQRWEIVLRRLLRSPHPPRVVVEFNEDRMTAPFSGLAATTVRLEDLAPPEAEELVRRAAVDDPISEDLVTKIASASGGRPLLMLESLRALRRKGGLPAIPRNLEDACRARVDALSPDARELLALLVVHPEPTPELLMKARARLELQTRDFIKSPPKSSEAGWSLSHPSLGPVLMGLLPWKLLWGMKALEHASRTNDLSRVLGLGEELRKRTQNPLELSFIEAHRAPALYRLGRYEEALAAYDAWYRDKPDDGTGVETVKHNLYTGLVLKTSGRKAEARKRLEDGLEAGDSRSHAHHRPYHARARLLLASLDREEGKAGAAKRHLETALDLARDDAEGRAEIERELGLIEQQEGSHERALARFERAAAVASEAANPQAEAVAWNLIGMLHRERGRPSEALPAMTKALTLSEKGGELAQLGRYTQNRALVFMDLGDWEKALETMDKAQDILETVGTDEDRDAVKAHREELKMRFELKTNPQTLAPGLPGLQDRRFRQFCEINRRIAQETDLSGVLERVLEAAIETTGAERGFVLLKKDASRGPVPGYEVAAARRFDREAIGEEDFKLSLGAVRQALRQRSTILTDDARLDPRFQERKSVVQYDLKAILIVPLEADGEILGAVYLDHRLQPGCFQEEEVTLLNALAVQAAMALRKSILIEELRAAKGRLETQVEEQSERIELLTREGGRFRYGYEEIVGQSPPMTKVFDLLDHFTDTSVPVWICGESGTGKELVARSLHKNSARKDGPFVAENVSVIPETLQESELFGHKKGAFTHADRDHAGLFEEANGGTLFLDEVADMSPALQSKLLRVLQEGEIRPVGSSKKIKVDVRLVTASNRDLNQLAREGKFREDLLFRINGVTVRLPPLRDRKSDLPALIDYLMKKLARSSGASACEVADDALQLFLKWDWPGNIRELESVLRNALFLAKGQPVTRKLFQTHADLFPFFSASGGGASRTSATPASPASDERQAERQVIVETLRRHRMDKKETAKDLGISLRNLYKRLDACGIPKKKTVLATYLGLR